MQKSQRSSQERALYATLDEGLTVWPIGRTVDSLVRCLLRSKATKNFEAADPSLRCFSVRQRRAGGDLGPKTTEAPTSQSNASVDY